MALQPVTRIRFFGVAAYEISTREGVRILVDPFLDENPGSPVKHDAFDKVDLVVVSHAAADLAIRKQLRSDMSAPSSAAARSRPT